MVSMPSCTTVNLSSRRSDAENKPFMKKFFSDLGGKLQQWMSGRYGYDELSRAMSVAAVIGLLLSCVPFLRFMYLLSILLWVWSVIRCCSRNFESRKAERESYLRFTSGIKRRVELKKKAWEDRKTYCYCRCRQCGATLRVPKGKGKIKITCPKCHGETIKKT